MKLLIVLCLGTLALSAPAPQKRGNQIDFLFDDDEIQASVRPVENSTVEPKVTATKISDPRKSGPVVEKDEAEDEEDANEQEQESRPIASPLNSESKESDNSKSSAEVNETDNDDLENENGTRSNASTDGTDSSVTDTTIRVYDDDEVDGAAEKEERPEQDVEQDEEQEQEQEREQEQANVYQSDPKTTADDSYQYDDDTSEKVYQSEEGPEKATTTAVPEPNEPTTSGDLNVELNHGTQSADKGYIGIQDTKTTIPTTLEPEINKYSEIFDWNGADQDASTPDVLNVELKSGQVFNHGTLIIEKGTFEDQDISRPFNGGPFPMKDWKMGERPDFANWPHGPYGPFGPHGHPQDFPGSSNEHPRFEGPPPWVVRGHHHHPPRFDHKSHEDPRGYFFHGNGFHRNVPDWDRHWEKRNSVPTTTTKGADLSQ